MWSIKVDSETLISKQIDPQAICKSERVYQHLQTYTFKETLYSLMYVNGCDLFINAQVTISLNCFTETS